MLKKWFAMVSIAVLAATCASAQQPVQSPYDYKSDGLSCTVWSDGSVHNLKAGDVTVLKDIGLLGNYLIAKDKPKHDARYFQGTDDSVQATVKDTGSNTFVIEKTGTMNNAMFAPGGKFTEKVTLSPFEINFEYEVETTPDKTLIYMGDTRSYGGKEFRFDFMEEYAWKSEPYVFPAGTKFKWSFTIKYQKSE